MRKKLSAVVEILLVYGIIRLLGMFLRVSGLVYWEIRALGWMYSGSLVFIGLPALLIWLSRRRWSY